MAPLLIITITIITIIIIAKKLVKKINRDIIKNELEIMEQQFHTNIPKEIVNLDEGCVYPI